MTTDHPTARRAASWRVPVAALLTALLLLALAIGLAMLGACGGDAPRAEAATPPEAVRDTALLSADAVPRAGLTIAAADSAPWQDAWSAPGRLTLDPMATQALGAAVEGRVTRALARVGDTVRAGQLLVAVHSHEVTDARGALDRARAADREGETALRLAESAAARAERLLAMKALSVADAERARGALAQAQAARAAARAERTRAEAMMGHLLGDGAVPAGTDEHEALLRAPMGGVVVGLDAQPGRVVLVGTPLVTLSRTTSLVLTLQVPERALAAARPGAAVRFSVDAFPGERFGARVTRVAPALDSVTRTVAVQAAVAAPGGRLRAEMFAAAELLGPAGARALVVPADAVQAMDGDTVVVTARPLGEGLLLEAVPVRVGRRTAERAEILDGVDAGTPVVVGGAAIAKAEILRRRGGR